MTLKGPRLDQTAQLMDFVLFKLHTKYKFLVTNWYFGILITFILFNVPRFDAIPAPTGDVLATSSYIWALETSTSTRIQSETAKTSNWKCREQILMGLWASNLVHNMIISRCHCWVIACILNFNIYESFQPIPRESCAYIKSVWN